MDDNSVSLDWKCVRASLEAFSEAACTSTRRSYAFRMVSQAQAVPVANSMADWFGSGKHGAPSGHSNGAIRASIYNQSLYAQQINGFLNVSRLACYEHAKGAISSIDEGSAIVSLSLLRGLIERASLAETVRSKLSGPWRDKAKEKGFHEVFYETSIAELIGKSLYGTRMDWQKLASSDFTTAKARELSYEPKEKFMVVSASQILNHVDKLGKRVPGSRVAYDVLCEFLHPNVGDLFATTTHAASRVDAWGTRHLTREISLGRHDFSGAKDLVDCLSKALEIVRSITDELPEIFSDLDAFGKEVSALNKKSMHRVRKRQAHLFNRNDLCPCLSGLTVNNCK